MPRTALLPRTSRGKVLALLGTAAALAGAGTASAASASAATVSPIALHAQANSQPPTLDGTGSALLTDTLRPTVPPVPATTGASHVVAAPAKLTSAAAPAKPAAAQAPAKPAAPAQPYEMYDSVTPSAIPAGHPIATYADGPYAATPAQVAGRQVTWIDTNTSDPGANVLDVEPGDATPPQAATWAQQRLTEHPGQIAVIYTFRSDWAACQAAIATLPQNMQSHVRWWIADPTGVPHMVPGSSATQWYWGTNYDISTVAPGF
jgi:hypothetical protein